MIAKEIIGRGLRGADNYAALKPGASMLCTNMAGATPRERAEEWRMLRSARPQLSRVAAHLILAHAPTDRALSADEWRKAVRIALEEKGAGDAAFVAVQHPPDDDHEHDHVHIVYCRVRADGSVVSDSKSYAANVRASREIERRLNLQPPVPTPPKKRIGDRRAADGARRRADRRGTPPADPLALIRAAVAAQLDKARSFDDLRARLAAHGVDAELVRKSGGVVQGWKLRPQGSDEWLKASTVHRSLRWPLVAAALERNAAVDPEAARPGAPNPQAPVAPVPTKQRAKMEPSPAPAIATDLQRELRQLDNAELHHLQRRLQDLPRPEAGHLSLEYQQRLALLLERLLSIVVRWLTGGRVNLPVHSASGAGAHDGQARGELARAIDAELEQRAVAAPRGWGALRAERDVIARRTASASAALAAAPSRDALHAQARVQAHQAAGVGKLREAHTAAQRRVAALQAQAPTGVLAKLIGGASRHAAQLATQRAAVAAAAAALRDAQQQAERAAQERYLPALVAGVARLERDVSYWQSRALRLEREDAALQRLAEVDAPRERAGEPESDDDPDSAERQRHRRERGG